MTRLLAVIVAALTLAGVASAAAGPTGPLRWTVAQANAAMTSRKTDIELVATYGLPIAGRGSIGWNTAGNMTKWRGYVFFHTIDGAACQGVGRAMNGTYAGFACDLHLARSPSPGVRTGTYWVRPMAPDHVCASDRALAACPLPLPTNPLPGDPRSCSLGSAGECINGAATYATITHNGGKSTLLGCLAASVFVYHCSWGLPPPNVTPPGTATVTFTPAKNGWTTSVVITTQS